MLSLFPSFLSYGELAPFLLRITLAAVLIHWSYGLVKERKTGLLTTLGLLEGVVGILLIIGLFTQLAAIVTALILLIKLIFKIRTKSLFTNGVNYYFILFIIAVSLLFLGAGAFSFDFPL